MTMKYFVFRLVHNYSEPLPFLSCTLHLYTITKINYLDPQKYITRPIFDKEEQFSKIEFLAINEKPIAPYKYRNICIFNKFFFSNVAVVSFFFHPDPFFGTVIKCDETVSFYIAAVLDTQNRHFKVSTPAHQ